MYIKCVSYNIQLPLLYLNLVYVIKNEFLL